MATTEVGLVQSKDVPVPVTRRERVIDLVFVLGISLWRPLFTSTLDFFRPTASSGSNLSVSYSLLSQLSSLVVLAYVLRKRGMWLRGITEPFRAADLVWGVGLFAVAKAGWEIATTWIRGACIVFTGFPPEHVPVDRILGLHLSVAWVLYQFVNPWKEELIVRGFLMTEVAALVGMPAAILFSSLLQASYHLYQGPVNVAGVLVAFLIFSVYYARTRRLFPILVAHTLMDVMALFYAHR